MGAKKVRVDHLLVERGLAESRTKAQALVMAGAVVVGEARVDKPGALVDPAAPVRIKEGAAPQRYVSRGALKLERALEAFPIDPRGKTCADLGASTGGFTDLLLQRGAARVHAVDVGYGQLHARLRADPRVVVRERENARLLDAEKLGARVDLIDGRDTLLPFLDGEVSRALTAAMERAGVNFRWKERVEDCRARGSAGIRLHLDSKS